MYVCINTSIRICFILHIVGQVTERRSLAAQFGGLFDRLKLDAVWRVGLFAFSVGFFTQITNNTTYDVAGEWCVCFLFFEL
jgi:hypothetical protein